MFKIDVSYDPNFSHLKGDDLNLYRIKRSLWAKTPHGRKVMGRASQAVAMDLLGIYPYWSTVNFTIDSYITLDSPYFLEFITPRRFVTPHDE